MGTGLRLDPFEIVDLTPTILVIRTVMAESLKKELEHCTRGKKTKHTHIGFRYPAEPDIRAILNDRITRAAEVDIDILAVVHAELPARYHNGTVFHASDVGRATNLAANQKTFIDVFNSQACKGFAVGGGNGHVDNAVM